MCFTGLFWLFVLPFVVFVFLRIYWLMFFAFADDCCYSSIVLYGSFY